MDETLYESDIFKRRAHLSRVSSGVQILVSRHF